LVQELESKLQDSKPDTASEVRRRVAEVIELADHDAWDLVRSRAVEQQFWTCSMIPRPAEIWVADLGLAAKIQLGPIPIRLERRLSLFRTTYFRS